MLLLLLVAAAAAIIIVVVNGHLLSPHVGVGFSVRGASLSLHTTTDTHLEAGAQVIPTKLSWLNLGLQDKGQRSRVVFTCNSRQKQQQPTGGEEILFGQQARR